MGIQAHQYYGSLNFMMNVGSLSYRLLSIIRMSNRKCFGSLLRQINCGQTRDMVISTTGARGYTSNTQAECVSQSQAERDSQFAASNLSITNTNNGGSLQHGKWGGTRQKIFSFNCLEEGVNETPVSEDLREVVRRLKQENCLMRNTMKTSLRDIKAEFVSLHSWLLAQTEASTTELQDQLQSIRLVIGELNTKNNSLEMENSRLRKHCGNLETRLLDKDRRIIELFEAKQQYFLELVDKIDTNDAYSRQIEQLRRDNLELKAAVKTPPRGKTQDRDCLGEKQTISNEGSLIENNWASTDGLKSLDNAKKVTWGATRKRYSLHSNLTQGHQCSTGAMKSLAQSNRSIASIKRLCTVPQFCKPESVPESCKPESVPQSCKPESVPQSCKPESVPQSCKPESVPQSCKPESVPTKTGVSKSLYWVSSRLKTMKKQIKQQIKQIKEVAR